MGKLFWPGLGYASQASAAYPKLSYLPNSGQGMSSPSVATAPGFDVNGGNAPGRVGADNPNQTGPMSIGMERGFQGLQGALAAAQAGELDAAQVAASILGEAANRATFGATGLLGNVSAAMRELGVPSQVSPWGGQPSLADVQTARDLYGAFAANEMAGVRDAWGTSFSDQTPGLTGYSEAESAGGTVGGDTTGGGLTDSGGNPGGDSPGQHEARGGVVIAKHGPVHITMGEQDKEMGIFVPLKGKYNMGKPGIQGNEKAVRKGLKAALNRLEGK